ncbi:hypothetical protein VU07_00370 [Desulfobulbus sp. F4]|nr:hypothetical protein [Desulfobulbus sp. F4]
MSDEISGSTAGSRACSFCGREEAEVARLIAGPDVYICSECVDICSGMIKEPTAEGGDAAKVIEPPGELM